MTLRVTPQPFAVQVTITFGVCVRTDEALHPDISSMAMVAIHAFSPEGDKDGSAIQELSLALSPTSAVRKSRSGQSDGVA